MGFPPAPTTLPLRGRVLAMLLASGFAPKANTRGRIPLRSGTNGGGPGSAPLRGDRLTLIWLFSGGLR